MTARGVIICAIIFGLLSIALALLGTIEQFNIDIPWYIVSLPSTFYLLFILLPYSAKQAKQKKNKQDKE